MCVQMTLQKPPIQIYSPCILATVLLMCSKINHTFKLSKSHLLVVMSSGKLDSSCPRN